MYFSYPFRGNQPYEVNLIPGEYLLEAWGASGGGENGGRGGYSSGQLVINLTRKFYIFVGGEGESSVNEIRTSSGGFNGGGNGGQPFSESQGSGGGGGGATDIRLNLSYGSRVLVSGGGGGQCSTFKGGDGGGLIGSDGNGNQISQGASQDTGNDNGIGSDGRTGTGFSGGRHGGGGGGGGYRGGLASQSTGATTNSAGGGGSSFVSGHPGCVSFPEFVFSEPLIQRGDEIFLSPNSFHEQGHSGNGYMKIQLIHFFYSCDNNNSCTDIMKYTLLLFVFFSVTNIH